MNRHQENCERFSVYQYIHNQLGQQALNQNGFNIQRNSHWNDIHLSEIVNILYWTNTWVSPLDGDFFENLDYQKLLEIKK